MWLDFLKLYFGCIFERVWHSFLHAITIMKTRRYPTVDVQNPAPLEMVNSIFQWASGASGGESSRKNESLDLWIRK